MIILLYILLFFILRIALTNLFILLYNKTLPKSYFEFENYRSDSNYYNNKKITKHKYRIHFKMYPDSVYPDKNNSFVMNTRIMYCAFGVIFAAILAFIKSIEFNNSLDINIIKLFYVFNIAYAILIILDVSIFAFIIRRIIVKRTVYYNTVYYKALFVSKLLKMKKKINVLAVLPIGHINLHFCDNNPKNKVTIIRLNRDKKIAELYSGRKRKYKVRYFDLNIIEHTDFLNQFIKDLTFVENKVDLKRLFTDVYFSDKDMIELDNYKIDTTHG